MPLIVKLLRNTDNTLNKFISRDSYLHLLATKDTYAVSFEQHRPSEEEAIFPSSVDSDTLLMYTALRKSPLYTAKDSSFFSAVYEPSLLLPSSFKPCNISLRSVRYCYTVFYCVVQKIMREVCLFCVLCFLLCVLPFLKIPFQINDIS